MTREQPFDAVKHLDNPEVIRAYVEETRAEIERQQADIDKLLAERQGWLDEIERLKQQLERANDPTWSKQPDEGLPTADDVRGILRESKP